MRETAYFIGSLAGAAIMTALALLIRPEAPLWKIVLWGGIGVFTACACVVVLDYIRPNGSPYFLAGTALGIALFVGCGTAFFFGPSFIPQTIGPDVTLRFVYPENPAVVLLNNSNKVANQIKWAVLLWNLDSPRAYSNQTHSPDDHEPLQIPFSTFDFLRAYTAGGPQNLFGNPLVEPFVRKGDRLFGSASVVCPECSRGHTYFVYIEYGKGGWYWEQKNEESGSPIYPSRLFKSDVLAFFERMTTQIPLAERLPISTYP
jgi:hypothetical protein